MSEHAEFLNTVPSFIGWQVWSVQWRPKLQDMMKQWTETGDIERNKEISIMVPVLNRLLDVKSEEEWNRFVVFIQKQFYEHVVLAATKFEVS